MTPLRDSSTPTTPIAPSGLRPSAKFAMLTPCRPSTVPDRADDARLIVVLDDDLRAFERRLDRHAVHEHEPRAAVLERPCPRPSARRRSVCSFTDSRLVKFRDARAVRLDDFDPALGGDRLAFTERHAARQDAA